MRKTTPPEERFTKFYFVDRASGCWIWTGNTNGKYPLFAISGSKNSYGHRFSYAAFVGPIPDGFEVDHQCDNVLCVNPDHLKAVTVLEHKRRHADLITHCPRGHPYNEDNTLIYKDGSRSCRECHRQREAARRERLKNAGFRL
jgi:hypothetical protein